jgi:hypothetical protein
MTTPADHQGLVACFGCSVLSLALYFFEKKSGPLFVDIITYYRLRQCHHPTPKLRDVHTIV